MPVPYGIQYLHVKGTFDCPVAFCPTEQDYGHSHITEGNHLMAMRCHLSCKYPQLFLVGIVLLALLLVGCSTNPSTGTTTGGAGAPISYNKAAGHILIQLFHSPGFIYPPISGVPDWTLYGDGTLIITSNPGVDIGSQLLEAHLTSGEVQHILDVVVNQNAFFASARDSYGRVVPDTGSLLLTVDANGQDKEVQLFAEPTASTDEQTQHVFAIKHFLLSYNPASTQPYVPPGFVLLVTQEQAGSAGGWLWPYDDIALDRVAAEECTYLRFGTNVCLPITSGKSGLFPIYGKRGVQVWQQWQSQSYVRVSQHGQSYQVIVWPLLPDALSPRPDGSLGVMVQGSQGGVWPLLPGVGKS